MNKDELIHICQTAFFELCKFRDLISLTSFLVCKVGFNAKIVIVQVIFADKPLWLLMVTKVKFEPLLFL